jgi:phosphate starvation-inducible protein PhoH
MGLPKNNLFFGFAHKLTNEQRFYVDSIFDKNIVFASARSGSGKTTLAVAAAKLLGKDLAYIFSPVEEKTLGFRPGSTKEKESDYIIPLKDALMEINEDPLKSIYNEDADPALLKKNEFWVFPMSHTFARGTNLKNKTVIIDEAQNFTRGELKKILTRIHDDCHVIVIGDPHQCDLKDPSKSGFLPYLEHFKNEPYVATCELTVNFRGKISAHAELLHW